MNRTLLITLMLGLSVASLSACVRGGSKSETVVSTTTTGQELTDLQKAFDDGVISEEEYNKKKAEILEQ